jgi:hypothetical protein
MIHLLTLLFPVELLINYVRVYQRNDQLYMGCDPKDFPTADYIAGHIDTYEGELLSFGWLVIAYLWRCLCPYFDR